MRFMSAAALFFSLLLLAPAEVSAMGNSNPPVASAGQNFKTGQAAVYAGKYDKAIGLMKKVVAKQPRNADAHNYLGFSYRKTGRLKLAAASYKAVFAIDADHKGALEYQGELFLKMGNLNGAERNLEHLTKLCASGCKEQAELKRAIADYQATQIKSRGS